MKTSPICSYSKKYSMRENKFEKRKNQIKNIEIKKCIENKPLQVKTF